MRLIDAEPLIKHLKNWQRELYENSNREYNILELVIRGIANEPVAFDIENVLKQLNELEDAALERCNHTYVGTYKHDFEDGKSVAYETAIDIVKGGGVNHE